MYERALVLELEIGREDQACVVPAILGPHPNEGGRQQMDEINGREV